MNPDNFKSSSAGHVIQVGQGEAAYWSFVPAPLPPALEFDAPLVSVLSEADRALGELAGLGRTMSNPHLLVGPFMRREAVLSSRIEGTQTELAELYEFEAAQLPLFDAKPSKRASDVREVLNYVRAFQHGLERLEKLPISLRLMREVHDHLMRNIRADYATPGEFRKSQNWIGKPGSTLSTAKFVPPPVAEMNGALDALEKFIHAESQLPPLVRIGLIHYQFEAIHPFLDGNGRIGRLLISLLLVNWNLLPAPLLYLSAFFEHHRNAYYEHLLAVSERGTWQEWLEFFLRGVAEQARDAIQRAKKLQDLQSEWRTRLQAKPRTSALLLRLVDDLFQSPYLTVPRVQNRFQISHRTARLMVKRLEQEKILSPQTAPTRTHQFAARQILEVLEAETL